MSGYTPVFKSILQSTIWECKPHVKVVWWSMLLMCDRDGIVDGSVPGLARSAVVTREQCEEALAVLLSPDPDSRTKDHEGRRIVEVAGGWKLLNHEAYQRRLGMLTSSSRERVARFRERKRQLALPVTEKSYNVTEGNHIDRDQDLEIEEEKSNRKSARAKTTKKISKGTPVEKPDGWAPTDSHREFATKHSIDLELESVKFKGHFDGQKLISWNGRFTTWLANAVGYAHERNQGIKQAVQLAIQPLGGLPGQVQNAEGLWFYPLPGKDKQPK